MKIILFSIMTFAVLTLSACASPSGDGTDQPLTADQAATIAVATLQALPSNTPVPELPAEVLPHLLYYLSNDGIYRRDNGTLLLQVYRMERDGKTISRLTDEPSGVDGYDVSLVDGTVAFIADNQLVLVNGDGSNRRVLVDGGSAKLENNPHFYKDPVSQPVFSPDGRTIAYSRKGLNLYDISSAISNLVIADQRSEMGLPIETYSPTRYSPDGTKLLVALGHWEVPPEYAIYDPETGALVRSAQEQGFFCCNGPVWSLDGSSFYGVTPEFQYAFQVAEIQRVDAVTGAVTTLFPFNVRANNETMNSPSSPYFAPDGWLYYFFGSYRVDSGYYEPPVVQLIRSAPDDVINRTVIRPENFVLMREVLWAPDAGFVIVEMASRRDSNDLGVLELYYTDAQKSPVWLAPFGSQMKWGP